MFDHNCTSYSKNTPFLELILKFIRSKQKRIKGLLNEIVNLIYYTVLSISIYAVKTGYKLINDRQKPAFMRLHHLPNFRGIIATTNSI